MIFSTNMFENIHSAKPERHWLLWTSLKAIGLGIACFFPAFFLSLLITIPWSKYHWAGEGQAVLGGMALSFYFGIASGLTAAVYILTRTIRSNRAQAALGGSMRGMAAFIN